MSKQFIKNLSSCIQFNVSPLKCGRTSAEPNGRKALAYKKFICLSKVSFEFLAKSFLERGNLTTVKLEAVERDFSFFFPIEKGHLQ